MVSSGVAVHSNEDALQRKQKLLAAKAERLAKMSGAGRRALERQVTQPLGDTRKKVNVGAVAVAGQDAGLGGILPQEIRSLIAEAHKLRNWAEKGRDIKVALKAVDTGLKALQLLGRATGQIRDQRSANVTVNVVPSREEGLQTAAELLLDLANADELILVIGRLQQRTAELEALKDRSTALPLATWEAPAPQLPAGTMIDGKGEE